MIDPADATHTTDHTPYRTLPAPISLAETSTTHDTRATDAYGSLGSIAATSPTSIALGPEGAGDGDGD